MFAYFNSHFLANQTFSSLPEILSKIHATMIMAENDELRRSYVELLLSIGETYTLILENDEKAINSIDSITQLVGGILDIITNKWVHNRDVGVYIYA